MVMESAPISDMATVAVIRAPALNALDYVLLFSFLGISTYLLVKLWKRKTKHSGQYPLPLQSLQ